jgi:chorismate-pyruvate lyase
MFEAALARRDSATLALEDWCAARRIADPPVVRAKRLPVEGLAMPATVERELNLARGERAQVRNVQLLCGDAVLSVAWNWYVPSRLTPAMNEALRTTDTPFGKVVAPLRFRREPLATVQGRAEEACPAGTVSTHRARLILPDGRPLAYLIECYTAANLGL